MENSKTNTTLTHKTIWVLAFLEGSAVMAIEMMAAKIISPYYGVSFNAWSIVIAMTLLCLTSGYFLGGLLSQKKETDTILFKLFLVSGIWIVLLPVCAPAILYFSYKLGYLSGIIFSALVILAPALITLGATTPIFINYLSDSKNQSGKSAGFIYGLSTVGGILTTFIFGFYILPTFGLIWPLFTCGLFLILLPIFLFRETRLHLYKTIGGLAVLLALAFNFIGVDKPFLFIYNLAKSDYEASGMYELQHISEGILGQLKVLDFEMDSTNYRILQINGITQTWIVNDSLGASQWQYVHTLSSIASIKKKKETQALLFGYGGGSLALELLKMNMRVDAVEFDKRMLDISRSYFYLPETEKLHFIVDDARHYMKVAKKKYDIIFFDLAAAEVQPSYVFTLEGLEEIKNLLTDDGILIINFQSYLLPELNMPFRSLYATLKHSGLNVYHWYNYPDYLSDIFFIASKKEIDFTRMSLSNLNSCCKELDYIQEYIKQPYIDETVETEDAYIFKDNQPVLDHLNAEAVKEWREAAIISIIRENMREGVGLYQ